MTLAKVTKVTEIQSNQHNKSILEFEQRGLIWCGSTLDKESTNPRFPSGVKLIHHGSSK